MQFPVRMAPAKPCKILFLSCSEGSLQLLHEMTKRLTLDLVPVGMLQKMVVV